MPSTIKTLEYTTYNTVCFSSFTKIHGRPTNLASNLDDITYAWS